MENSPEIADVDGFVQELTGCQDDLILFIRTLCGDFHLAADIRQEVNMVLWNKRRKFTPGTSFRSWASVRTGANATASLGSLGLPGTVFQVGDGTGDSGIDLPIRTTAAFPELASSRSPAARPSPIPTPCGPR